jgi:hypothetical protein
MRTSPISFIRFEKPQVIHREDFLKSLMSEIYNTGRL